MIIDAHIHLFEDDGPVRSFMERARAQGIEPKIAGDGTVPAFLRLMATAHIDRALMVNTVRILDAVREAAPDQVPSDPSQEFRSSLGRDVRQAVARKVSEANRWSCELVQRHPSLAACIALDPVMTEEEQRREIERWGLSGQAKGVKFHNESQYFFADDRGVWPAYAMAEQHGFPVVCHTGRHSLFPQQFSHPRRLQEVLRAFPRLCLVLAHVGCDFFDEHVALAKKYPQLAFDLSITVSDHQPEGRPLPDERIVDIVRRIGAERLIYGSDWPACDPAADIERIERLPLTNREKAQVLSETAVRVYNLR